MFCLYLYGGDVFAIASAESPVQPSPILSSEKLKRRTSWQPHIAFEMGPARTIDWYRASSTWVAGVQSGAYWTYYEANYGSRGAVGGRVSENRCS